MRVNVINSPASDWLPGGRWAVRLQVRVQPRGALFHGLPRQPEAEPESRPGRHPAPRRGRRLPAAQLRGGGPVPCRRGGAVHPGIGFSRQLPVLDHTHRHMLGVFKKRKSPNHWAVLKIFKTCTCFMYATENCFLKTSAWGWECSGKVPLNQQNLSPKPLLSVTLVTMD